MNLPCVLDWLRKEGVSALAKKGWAD